MLPVFDSATTGVACSRRGGGAGSESTHTCTHGGSSYRRARKKSPWGVSNEGRGGSRASATTTGAVGDFPITEDPRERGGTAGCYQGGAFPGQIAVAGENIIGTREWSPPDTKRYDFGGR
jgi:hypothetical protein